MRLAELIGVAQRHGVRHWLLMNVDDRRYLENLLEKEWSEKGRSNLTR